MTLLQRIHGAPARAAAWCEQAAKKIQALGGGIWGVADLPLSFKICQVSPALRK